MIQAQIAMICAVCSGQFTLHTRVSAMDLETIEREVQGTPCPHCHSESCILFNPNPPEEEDSANWWRQ
jgi:hypothetical protein